MDETINIVVNRTSPSDNPSMPRYASIFATPPPGKSYSSHGVCMPNCGIMISRATCSGDMGRNLAATTSDSASVTSVVASAVQRTACARPEPKSAMPSAPTSGRRIMSISKLGIMLSALSCQPNARRQDGDTQEHQRRVRLNQPGLPAAEPAANNCRDSRHPIYGPIDGLQIKRSAVGSQLGQRPHNETVIN